MGHRRPEVRRPDIPGETTFFNDAVKPPTSFLVACTVHVCRSLAEAEELTNSDVGVPRVFEPLSTSAQPPHQAVASGGLGLRGCRCSVPPSRSCTAAWLAALLEGRGPSLCLPGQPAAPLVSDRGISGSHPCGV